MKNSCFITDSTYLRCDIVRRSISDFASRYFYGWDDEFDRQFDDRAIWFILPGRKKEILAVIRVIFRTYFSSIGPLPFERAIINEATSSDDCEISGVAFTDKKYLYITAMNMISYLNKIRINRCYALLNSQSDFFSHVHYKILHSVKVQETSLVFPGFKHKDSNADVLWDLVEVKQENFANSIALFNKLAAPVDKANEIAWLLKS